MTRVLGLLLALWLGSLALPAQAATSCSLTSPTLSFGPVSNGQVDTTTTFTINCTTGAVALLANVRVTFCVGLPAGTGGTTITPRARSPIPSATASTIRSTAIPPVPP
ncbi:spore coat protein U domain-containing protein [Stenotrophomonas maltophilia]|uniref:spore coat protein U domain-containing protein n=1 Tax=Stenotrophomonas maltophilia TaxID=40324 RepID=UPI001F2C9F1E|nr:spore coat protein U domain-containing protein [Stenotrophomonas maltophilia]